MASFKYKKCFTAIIGTRTISDESNKTRMVNINPAILLSYLIRSPLKKLIIFPIHTTGCILTGNSPINKSNAKAKSSVVSNI